MKITVPLILLLPLSFAEAQEVDLPENYEALVSSYSGCLASKYDGREKLTNRKHDYSVRHAKGQCATERKTLVSAFPPEQRRYVVTRMKELEKSGFEARQRHQQKLAQEQRRQ